MTPAAPATSAVKSSLLVRVSYDAVESHLQLAFSNGAIYQYFGVPEAIHQALLAAGSMGSYFNHQIRSRFRYVCVQRPTRRPTLKALQNSSKKTK